MAANDHDDAPRPFDLIGERYDHEFTDRVAQLAEGEWLIGRLPAGARVLDVGCGTGIPTARQLAAAGLDVVGIDESATMVELASANVPAGTFLRQDIREIGPELGEFDAATAFFSLLMLSRAEIPLALRAIRDRLRGPGSLSVGMVLGDFDRLPISFLDVPIEVTAYPAEALAEVVGQAGFTVEQVRQVETGTGSGHPETQLHLRATARG